jgi:amidase
MQFDYTNYDAMALAELIKARQVSPLEVLEAAIHQIELINPTLNAINFPLYDAAYAQVEQLQLGAPFAGVPIVIKDLLAEYKGIPTSYGSRWLRSVPAMQDSDLVARYKKAGFVIVGKSNVPEFGLGAVTEPAAFGLTHNPWVAGYTPGGSSGGSAAAVAAGMVPVAHANDGGGSIRIPASCCGLFGLKPTRGRTPTGTAPLNRDWQGLIVEHVLTRTVRDSAAILDLSLIKSHIPSFHQTSQLPPKRLRIGYLLRPIFGHAQIHSDCLDSINHTIAQCVALGHTAKEITFPYDADALQRAYGVITTTEIMMTLRQFTAQTGHAPERGDIELMTQTVAHIGKQHTAADLVQALAVMKQSTFQVEALFADVDVILTPILTRPPVKEGFFQPKMHETALLNFLSYVPAGFLLRQLQKEIANKVFSYVAFTPLCNLSGHPAMSVPLYRNAQGLPIGSHFIGRFNDEATLLQLATELEEAFPWTQTLQEDKNLLR